MQLTLFEKCVLFLLLCIVGLMIAAFYYAFKLARKIDEKTRAGPEVVAHLGRFLKKFV